MYFDNYLTELSEAECISDLDIPYTSFKVFERIIERAILDFYEIKDASIRDMIFSSIFYAVYGNAKKSTADKAKELEDLFHTLKQFNLSEESYLVTSKLLELHEGTQLEPVYKYLSDKYAVVSYKKQLSFQYLTEFNQLLTDIYNKASKKSGKKEIIACYKEIRSLYLTNENNTSKAIFHLVKFECVSLLGQKQLLKDGNNSVQSLIKNLSNEIDAMAFGIERFYLKNIYTHLYADYLCSIGKTESALDYLNRQNSKGIIKGYNFNFPNHISEKILNKRYSKIISFNKVSEEVIETQRKKSSFSTTNQNSHGDFLSGTILN